MEGLFPLISGHVPHASLTLTLPSPMIWDHPADARTPWCLSHTLHHLSVRLGDADDNLAAFVSGLTTLQQLRRLEVLQWPEDEDDDEPSNSLPGLESLPRLGSLYTRDIMPPQAWLCAGLTALHCVCLPDSPQDPQPLPDLPAEVACTALRRLQLSGCSLPGGEGTGAFPPALCRLRKLTCLEIVRWRRTKDEALPQLSLPACFSQLRSLRQLSLDHSKLSVASMAALCPLSKLTALSLAGCHLPSLPHGPYLSSLISLDISGNALESPLPFHVTAASRLRALSIGVQPEAGEEGWGDMRTRLVFLRRLQVLFVDNWVYRDDFFNKSLQPWPQSEPTGRAIERDSSSNAMQALVGRLQEAIGRSAEVAAGEELSGHPVYGRAEWDTIAG